MKRQDNDMVLILSVLKRPEIELNANSLAKIIGISSMGALKIAKKLEEQGILTSRQVGKAKILKINFDNNYALQYVKLMLGKEVQKSDPLVKRWISEIHKIGLPAILYGSVLSKKEPNDIDVMFIIEKKDFSKIKVLIEEVNLLNPKKIHPLYQTKEDLIANIKKKDKVILNAIKGIVINADDLFISILKEVQ
jgi:DNA-binding Lrp family transcriptional regulator